MKISRKPRGTPNGCRVLVVDDDGDNVESLLELLRLEGYLATSAANGAAALALLANGFDPDVILTDLMMPVWPRMNKSVPSIKRAQLESSPI